MPGVAVFEKTAGNSNDHRCGKAIVGPPSHRAAIVQLLCCRVGILAKLDFGYRHQAGYRHTDGAADDAFFREAGIENPINPESFLQTPRRRMHTALGPDVFAKDSNFRVRCQFIFKRTADGRQHVDSCRLWFHLLAGFRKNMAADSQAALLLDFGLAIRSGFAKSIALYPGGIGLGSRKGRRESLGDLPLDFLLQFFPGVGVDQRRRQVVTQFWQRITGFLRREGLGRLVFLRVLRRMATQSWYGKPQQGRAGTAAYVFDRLADQTGRLGRLRAIAVQYLQMTKRLQVVRYVCPRRLQSR